MITMLYALEFKMIQGMIRIEIAIAADATKC